VGVLHPGEMGSVLGAILRGGGGRVVWASEGRSGPSHDRATRAGLEDVGTLPALVRESAVILAVCPPHAALAVKEGVDEALAREWERSQPDLPARLAAAVRGSVPTAWRFVGEREESAATFAAAGLPDGFSSAAALVYRRLEQYKDTKQPPAEGEIAAALCRG